MKFEFSAGGIIYRKYGKQYQFALILDSYDKWTFPKGHIEKGEKPEAAALREAGEEVGINNLKITRKLAKIDYWFKSPPASGGKLIHKFVYLYLIKAPTKATLKHQKTEIKEARWFSHSRALAVLGYKKDSLNILQKAIDILKKTSA